MGLTPQAPKTFHFTWVDVAGELEYQLLESPDGVAPLVAIATISANTTSYDLVVPLFRRVGARYVLRACNGPTCSDSQPVVASGALAGAVGYFKASNTGPQDFFGSAVALSADGNTLAVGAFAEDSAATGIGGDQTDNLASESGAVLVFSRSGAAWVQQAYVKPSNTGTGDMFGWAVALSADGNTLAVGAFGEDSTAIGVGGNQADNTAPQAGAVYVFSRTGSNWSQQAYLKASNTGEGDAFGTCVALSGDGNTLAVGAPNEFSSATGVGGNQLDNSAGGSGAVYMFAKVGNAWSQQAYVKASNTGAEDSFGFSIALSGDGNTLAVGARNEDSSATGVGGNQTNDSALNSGAVYVFSRSGTAWSQQAYVKGSNSEAFDSFGVSVALSANGNTLAIGAPNEDSGATSVGGNQADNSAGNSGAVYVFFRSGTAWSQQGYVKAPNTGSGDLFGSSVTLSGDGAMLGVGAREEDGSENGLGGNPNDNTAPNSGAAYLFSRMGAVWSEQSYIKASNTGAGDLFGASVALSGDGNTLAVGAAEEASSATGVGANQNDNTAGGSGAVYAY